MSITRYNLFSIDPHRVCRYSRVSRKKDDEKSRFEANAELFLVRKDWHYSLLEYVDGLNRMTLKSKFVLAHPLISFISLSSKLHLKATEIFTDEFNSTLSEAENAFTDMQTAYSTMASGSPSRLATTVHSSTPHYYPDPDPSDPFLEIDHRPLDTNQHEKAGYVFVRRGTVKHTWQRCYLRISDGVMVIMEAKQERLVMQLRDARASAAAADDRRYTFAVCSPIGGKKIMLQAESDRSMQVSGAKILHVMTWYAIH